MNKLKLWDAHATWEEAEQDWDQGAQRSGKEKPIRHLKQLPNMPGITEDTAKHLKWKSFHWILTQDHQGEVRRGFFKHPFRFSLGYLRSLFAKKSYYREGDFFFYGIKNLEEFQHLLVQQDHLLVIGFSYCHKPFECPSGRFTSTCIHDPDHPVCRQCFIGKAVNALPEKDVIPLFIPTVHYIGGKIFELMERYPNKTMIFLITACEMTLEMFGDLGNMVGIKGIGVRLDGRICNTMEAFKLSEKGIKPGLTVVLEPTQRTILDLIKLRRSRQTKAKKQ